MKHVLSSILLFFCLTMMCQNRELDSILNVYKQAKAVDSTKVNLALKLCMGYLQEGDSSNALLYGARAIEFSRTANWDKGLARSYATSGTAYYMYGNFARALEYYLHALSTYEKIKYEPGKAHCFHNIGNVYLDKKDVKNALINYNKSCAINEKLDNKAMLSNTYNNVANAYKSINDFNHAIVYYTKSFRIRKSKNDQKGLASSYINIGGLFIKISGLSPDSMAEYLKVLQLESKQDAKKSLLDSALSMQQEAIKINTKLNNKEALSFSYKAIGDISMLRSNHSKALTDYKIAFQYALEANDPLLMTDVSKAIYGIYKLKKNYQEALLWHEKYNEMSEAMSSKENQKEFGRQEAKFEYEKQKAVSEMMYMKQHTMEEAAKQEQKWILWFTLFALLLVVIISFFIYNRLKVSKHQNRVIESQKQEVENQKLLVEEKQKEIIDSIHYAKRIQYALLASDTLLKQNLPEYFVLFKPKDVVSGDFYWATPTAEGFIYVIADCTGHGVPGAFMSLLNISKLSQAINENQMTRPDLILNNVRSEIISVLNAEGKEESKDGMDAVVCKLDLHHQKLQFAAANNEVYIIRDKALIVGKADKMPVGKGYQDHTPFTFNEISLQAGDCIYTFTDGYADQFGGPKGKKFMHKQLRQLLLSIAHQPMEEQKKILNETIENWKGKLDQVDDICIVGVRI